MIKRKVDEILVLRRINHKDNQSIIEAYSKTKGLTSFSFLSGKKRRSQRNNILLRPPHLLEIEYLESSKYYPKIVRLVPLHTFTGIQSDIKKSAVALFLTEVIRQSVQEPDSVFFNWLKSKIIELDKETFYPDYHVKFLQELAALSGILPGNSSNGIIFAFQKIDLSEEDLSLLKKFTTTGKIENKMQRQRLTHLWIKYLDYYLEGFKSPKSLDILEQIFK